MGSIGEIAEQKLLHLLDIVGLPSLLKESFGRAVETQEGEPACAWDGGNPILALPPVTLVKVSIDLAVGVLDEPFGLFCVHSHCPQQVRAAHLAPAANQRAKCPGWHSDPHTRPHVDV